MPANPTLTAAVCVLLIGLTACGSSTDPSSSSEAAATGPRLIEPGKLTVCSDVPYPPFEDFDQSAPSGFKGFDIDVLGYVAEDIGLELVVKDSDFDALQSGLALNAGQCDIVASALTITDARKDKLAFTSGYYDSQQSLLVVSGSPIADLADLSGAKLGVQKGTTGESYAEANVTGADIVSFPSDAQMYAAIKAGQVDALLQDLPVNVEHERDPNAQGAFRVVQTYQTDEQYGFAASKTNTGLVEDIDASLEEMRSSGAYQELFDTYFAAS